MKVFLIFAAMIAAWYIGMVCCLCTIARAFPLTWKALMIEKEMRKSAKTDQEEQHE